MKLRLLLPLFGLFLACSTQAMNFDAIVTKHPHFPHEYTTLADAFDAIPEHHWKTYKIFVKNGVYEEKIKLEKSNVEIIGQSQRGTVIEYEAASGQLDADGNRWGTSGSYVLNIDANHVTLKNLTVRNSFDYLTNDGRASDDPDRVSSSQAVALLIDVDAQYIKLDHVTLLGYQDTLYVKDNSLSYFKNSIIKGNVDFIFGGGTAVFDSCDIIARMRNHDTDTWGYVTAPSTNINQPYGLVFYYSYIGKEPGVPAGSYGLGRPWHPTTTFDDGRYADPDAIGYTLFYRSYLDDHVAFWGSMSGTGKDGDTVTFDPLEDARFAEYQNIGPGAQISADRPQLSYWDAAQINLPHILHGFWYLKN